MVVLGVVLVLLALAVGILLVAGVASLEGTVDVAVPGGTLSFPPLTFLVTGMVVISVFWLGWVVLRTGVRHSRRRHAEAKEAAKEAEAKRLAEEERLKEEFAARERQLIEERRRHDSETAELKRGTAGTAPKDVKGPTDDKNPTDAKDPEGDTDPTDPKGPKQAGDRGGDGDAEDKDATGEDATGEDATRPSGSTPGSGSPRPSGDEGREPGPASGRGPAS